MKFYLGTHHPHWLRLTGVPLFVCHRTLKRYRTLPRALGSWALDSGAFSEINSHGGFLDTPAAYARAVRRYQDEVGLLAWAAPQDWMCEPFILAKTGLTMTEHQQRTVHSYLELRSIAPDLPFAPVLQGYRTADSYLRCADLYQQHGVDLQAEPIVGVGSVCKLQATPTIAALFGALDSLGLRLHGFGVKTEGLNLYGTALASSDSLAWSAAARNRKERLPGCLSHKNCANCLRYALAWRERVISRPLGALQTALGIPA